MKVTISKFSIIGVFYFFLLSDGLSQSTLSIYTNAGYVAPYNSGTGYNVDSTYGEISGCYLDNRLFIFVIDTLSFVTGGCEPWETNYAGTNPDHNFGSTMYCRNRPEAYFQYDQSDPGQMQSLDSLINYWIPNGYVFGMYSWVGYDYPLISSSSPSLANTLSNYWGVNAASSHTAAIFFAVQGEPSTYDMIYSDNTPDTIQMVKQICIPINPNGFEDALSEKIKVSPNPFTHSITVNGIVNDTEVYLCNTLGEVLGTWLLSENNTTINTENLREGVYFLRVGSTTTKLIKH
jgi:hypothetical protein